MEKLPRVGGFQQAPELMNESNCVENVLEESSQGFARLVVQCCGWRNYPIEISDASRHYLLVHFHVEAI